MIKKFIIFILNLFGIGVQSKEQNIERSYSTKRLMTNTEYKFFQTLKNIENEYIIHPQLPLSSIIKKTSKERYASELNRIIDFAIFDKEYKNILLLIELNDSSHDSYKRKERDLKVRKLCERVNIPLMTFYTKYSNKDDYVVNRIINEINKSVVEKDIS